MKLTIRRNLSHSPPHVNVVAIKRLSRPNASDVTNLPVIVATFYGPDAEQEAKVYVEAKERI